MRMYSSPVIILALAFSIYACAPLPPASPFIPPGNESLSPTAEALPFTPPPLPTVLGETPVPGPTLNNPTDQAGCINSLRFVEDINFPDGTIVRPGEKIEKLWRVQNDGTCSWDSRYSMQLVSGDQLGAPAELALYPALPGSQAELRVIFIAPPENRYYQSTWQAFSPEGTAFGDPFFINIVVQNP